MKDEGQSFFDSPEASRPRRLSRPELFVQVAALYGRRSSCPRADVGVIAVRDGRIIATGYCGAPSGMKHCDEVGCMVVDGGCVRSVHAEANMIAWSAREGIALKGSTVYCTHEPCYNCAKLLANTGIEEVHYTTPYRDHTGTDLLMGLNILVLQWA
jgi:dCMP deaminase